MNDSKALFATAQKLIPGGVNSPVRACRSVDQDPLFIRKGRGSKIITEEGHEMLDFVMSWGPLILGHSHPEVIQAVHQAVDNGSSFGAPCFAEIELAQEIVQALPGVEMVRMVNSGTEASMSAIRVARAHTGRDKILKFTGCYHGHVDSLLAQSGSGIATLAIPGTPGVPDDTVKHTLLANYNDLEAVQEIFQKQGEEIAAVIVEPVAGNMGLVLPREDFLTGLRKITKAYGVLLIFDEVITGFRIAYGGAQTYYNVHPDLTCLGKIIGGGFSVGAFGGKAEIMQNVAPCGRVYQAGTLAGNPVAMAAGLATLKILQKNDYSELESRTAEFASSLQNILLEKGVPVQLNCLSSAFSLFFTPDPVYDFSSAQKSDAALFKKFYTQMRNQNIYLAPSNFECIFTSFAHDQKDMQKTLEAVRKVSF